MKEKLEKLLNNAYAPYSNYHVSSIVVMKDGSEFSGVNYENASFGSTICAERNAIGTAITNGYTKGDFKEIYVMTDNINAVDSEERPGACCFACRQVFVEFCDKDTLVVCMNKLGEEKRYTVEELCPYPFDESDLK
jgi:cytidine deaminase, homotetrameric